MPAATYDFEIEQGATLNKGLVWKSSTGALVNLSGYTARMQLRPSVSSDTVLLELTTENGGITLGGTAGTIDLYVGATATAAINWEGGVFDLEIIHPGALPDDVTRIVQGTVSVSPEVTRV